MKLSVLTSADECGGGLADVVPPGVAFGGEGGDVVEQPGHQAPHHVRGPVPVQVVGLADAAAQWAVGDDEAADQAVGRFRLVPAQLHLVLLHTQHVETRRRQQV